jgi:hypothetical protein
MRINLLCYYIARQCRLGSEEEFNAWTSLTLQSSAADPQDPYAPRFARALVFGRLFLSGKIFPGKKFAAIA